jgi:hypothetical protein
VITHSVGQQHPAIGDSRIDGASLLTVNVDPEDQAFAMWFNSRKVTLISEN